MTKRLIVMAFAIALCAIAPAFAATWDYATDFSTTTNPLGQWQYGRIAGIGGAYNLHGNMFYGYSPDDGSVVEWRGDDAVTTWNQVMAVKNVSGAPVTAYYGTGYLETGMAALHPTGSGELSTARWTATSSGQISISARFSGQCYFQGEILGPGTGWRDGTTTDVHVVKNGTSLFDGSVMGFAGTADSSIAAFGNSPVQTYTSVISVQAGDVIDFCVGNGGNEYFSDITGLSATITEIPEPSSVLAMMCGMAGFAGYIRRRRS